MAAYLIRRLWQMVPTLFGVVLLVFLLFKCFGGDPAEILGGLNATPGAGRRDPPAARPERAAVDAARHLPEADRHLRLGHAAGPPTSRSRNLFATRLPATLTVMVPILMLDTLLAIPFAIGVAYVRGSLTDRAIMVADHGGAVDLVPGLRDRRPVRVRVPARLVPGAGLERQRRGPTCASTRRCRCCWRCWSALAPTDAAVPHLLPRRDRPRLRAHRARQGPDRAHRAAQARAAQRDDPDPHQRRRSRCRASSSARS